MKMITARLRRAGTLGYLCTSDGRRKKLACNTTIEREQVDVTITG
jgi:hypothetical protein